MEGGYAWVGGGCAQAKDGRARSENGCAWPIVRLGWAFLQESHRASAPGLRGMP